MEKKCIPVIDIANESHLAAKIVKACQEWGCFRIVNHGVPMELMSEMKAVTRSLTDLPMEMKLNDSHPDTGKGYTPPNMASPVFEGLSIYDIASPEAFDNFCSQIEASPQQRQVLNKYALALYDLAQLPGRKVMEGLGMEGDLFKNWPCQLKMNKYNYGPETVGSTGGIMHTDPGFLTIFQDDEMVNGLEAVDKISGELVPVDPIPGSFVVNVGDVATRPGKQREDVYERDIQQQEEGKGLNRGTPEHLAISDVSISMVWSNGRFYNVKHRVQCYEATVRNSIALSVLAPRDEKVEAPPQLVDSDHPRLYVPFYFEDYRKHRGALRTATGEGLQSFLAKTC